MKNSKDFTVKEFTDTNGKLYSLQEDSNINKSTSNVYQIAAKIEIRKKDMIGCIYYMTNDKISFNEKDYKKVVDVYSEAIQHVFQGLHLRLYFDVEVDTKEFKKAQYYAFGKGIKTLYSDHLNSEFSYKNKINNKMNVSQSMAIEKLPDLFPFLTFFAEHGKEEYLKVEEKQ